jgi:hypothetical protein
MLTTEQTRELAALESKGNLSPDAVIDVARKPSNPLHEFFDWNDATAAHSYRIEQARTLIRSVRIEVMVNDETIKVPQYLHNPGLRGQGYVSVARLKNDKEMAVEAVLRELSLADAAMRRSVGLAASLGVQKEIERIRAAVHEGSRALDRLQHQAVLMTQGNRA